MHLREELSAAESRYARVRKELDSARRRISELENRVSLSSALVQVIDDELDRVVTELHRLDPHGHRFATVLRRTLDQIYDGAVTGRFRRDQVTKTEKDYLGELVAREVQREFQLSDGAMLYFSIAGAEVDYRFSAAGLWAFPRESVSCLGLVVSVDDERSRFSVGVVRLREELLSPGGNRDGRSTLSRIGRSAIRYLVQDADLPENVLLHLPAEVADTIFAAGGGQQRLNKLFRLVQRRRIGIVSVRTVVMQPDTERWVREARRSLAPEGVVILGQRRNNVAQALHLSELGKGEWLSARLVQRRPEHGDAPAFLDGGRAWVVARPEDPVEPAPVWTGPSSAPADRNAGQSS
ncbi:NaeI family type II restriction endonuclease [Nocardia goodfellowii]